MMKQACRKAGLLFYYAAVFAFCFFVHASCYYFLSFTSCFSSLVQFIFSVYAFVKIMVFKNRLKRRLYKKNSVTFVTENLKDRLRMSFVNIHNLITGIV